MFAWISKEQVAGPNSQRLQSSPINKCLRHVVLRGHVDGVRLWLKLVCDMSVDCKPYWTTGPWTANYCLRDLSSSVECWTGECWLITGDAMTNVLGMNPGSRQLWGICECHCWALCTTPLSQALRHENFRRIISVMFSANDPVADLLHVPDLLVLVNSPLMLQMFVLLCSVLATGIQLYDMLR